MPANASARVVITGYVQGVLFRDFTRRKAQQLGLSGYVKNTAEGSVEVLAEGRRPAIDEFIGLLRQGPPRAVVVHVDITWGVFSKMYDGFTIGY